MTKVEVEAAGPEHRETLANLFQLYTHDFSDFWTDLSDGDLQENGRFAPYPHLDSYGTLPGREALLIRSDRRLAGFALINGFAHSGLPIDFTVAEYFVARKYRRAGVGQAAAQDLMRARPGQWELAVARRNTGALAFWRRVTASVAIGPVEELDLADHRWNGQILRFRTDWPS
jgi:predicted acetyltransferase